MTDIAYPIGAYPIVAAAPKSPARAVEKPEPEYRCTICRKFTTDIDTHLAQSHPRG